MPKYKLKSKIGRPYWAAGTEIGPDKWVELELDEKQLRELAYQCVQPCAEGGVFDIAPDPFAGARAAYDAAREAGKPPAAAMRIAVGAMVASPTMAAPRASTASSSRSTRSEA